MKLENKSRMEKYGEIRQNKKKELDVKIFKTEKRKRYKKKNDENGEEIQNAFKLKSMRKGVAR